MLQQLPLASDVKLCFPVCTCVNYQKLPSVPLYIPRTHFWRFVVSSRYVKGGDDDCRCDDPTMAMSNEQMKGWLKAHKYNKLLLDSSSNPRRNVDVVLVGDQVMEEWNARWYGTPNDEYKEVKTYFDKTFTRAGGGDIDGIALGVAGDSVRMLRVYG